MLIALARTGVAVTIMTQGRAPYARRFREAGITVIDFHPPRRFSPAAIRRIRAELRAGGYDVLYCFNNRAIANSVWAALGLPVKLVTYRGQTGNIRWWDPVCYLTHLHPRVDAIICVAESVRTDLLRQSRLPPDRIVTIHKGHDPEWYADVTPADLTSLGIPAGAPVAVCVANARPRKGLPVLLRAFHQLPDNGWHLLLVGTGTDSDGIRALISAGPAAARIHVAGFRSDVLALVAACRLGILPATKREGLPKTVIESMALGLPVVVTDSGGSRELVREGVTGHVVPAGDVAALGRALASLMADEDRRRDMGQAAREHLFRYFRSRDAGEQTGRFLRSLVATSDCRRSAAGA
jgi:glycosyltransferase involved in cell wall biosynthesis